MFWHENGVGCENAIRSDVKNYSMTRMVIFSARKLNGTYLKKKKKKTRNYRFITYCICRQNGKKNNNLDVNLNGKHTNAEEWSLVKTICLKAEVLIKKDIAKIAKKQKSVAQNLKGFSNEIGAIKSQLGLRKSLTEKINIGKSRVSTDSAQLLNRMKVLFDKVRMELEMVVRKTRLYDCEEIFSRTQDEEIEIIKEGLEKYYSLINNGDTKSR